jgi:hypothetical protein
MQFFIEAKQFSHEFGTVWRGRAVTGDGKKELNFSLPLPQDAKLPRAEVATVYELAKILPSIMDADMSITILVRSEATKHKVLNTPTIQELMGDLDLTLDVYDEDTTSKS